MSTDSMMGHDETSNGSYEITNTVDPTKETSETNEVETSDEVDPEAQKEMKKEISDSDTKRREFSHVRFYLESCGNS